MIMLGNTILCALKWKGRHCGVVAGRGGDSPSVFGRCNRAVAVTTFLFH